jgi:ABC-2 type transport system permease protein
VRPLGAQIGAELRLTLRRGDSVLLNLAIPLGLLVFFSVVDVLPKPAGVRHPVDFLVPGVLALAVMSTAMVSLGIATGFERQYLVLKRLAVTPLGRTRLLTAKIVSIVAIEAVQVALIVAVGLALGWHPKGPLWPAVPAVPVGTVAFAGLGLLMAGTLRAEVTLAAANGLYLLLLLLGGMVIPLGKLPSGLRAFAEALPAGALSDLLHAAFRSSAAGVPVRAWVVLGAWAIGAPVLAARLFRWE